MINYYFLAMYIVRDNGDTIEDASFFIRSPQFINRQQIKELIGAKEKYKTENIMLSSIIKIGEEMFNALAENSNDRCFKIVESGYEL